MNVREISNVLCRGILLVAIVILTACDQQAENDSRSQQPQSVSMANPASVNCIDQGGELELKTDDSGAVHGLCLFADGSECEEWALFRGECSPGQKSSPSSKPIE